MSLEKALKKVLKRLHGLYFLFFDLPSNLTVAQFGLHFFFLFLGHLSMNRLRLRRSVAALLFPVHHRVGDSIRFLLVLVAGLAHREFHLRPGNGKRAAPTAGSRNFVIGFGLDFIRVLLHHMGQLMGQ
jgi:hypothetical protein